MGKVLKEGKVFCSQCKTQLKREGFQILVLIFVFLCVSKFSMIHFPHSANLWTYFKYHPPIITTTLFSKFKSASGTIPRENAVNQSCFTCKRILIYIWKKFFARNIFLVPRSEL